MLVTDKIPEYIYRILEEEGVNCKNLAVASYCDMNDEYVFCDTYVFATLTNIYVLSGTVSLEKSDVHGRLSNFWNKNSFCKYDISEIESLKCEEMLSSARLTAKTTGGEYIFITAFTNTCKNSILLLIKYFERIKKGEIVSPEFEIDKEDDPKESCCPKCGMRYPDKNRKICPKCMEKGKLYRRFGIFLVKYKKHLAILLMSLLLLTATGVLVPYFSNEFFFDEVLDPEGNFFGELLLVIGIIISTRLLSQLFSIINGLISAKIAARIVFDLKMTVFKSIEKLSLTFFGGRQTGGLMTQVNNDSNTIYSFFCDGVPYFLIT